MIAMGLRSTADRARRVQVHSSELHGIKSEWMISDEDPSLSPTIFLVEQPAGLVLPAHFHRNNQFQLVVAGTGKIGPTKLEPVTIHYAGAYTADGPLVAGPDGLKYFTIRPVHESGMQVVAGSVEVEAVTLGLWESVFLSSNDLKTPVRAGAGGAQVAILAPPALAPAYRT